MTQRNLDAETLAQAAMGDESAWRRLVESCGPRVFGLLYSQCRDAELAEEVTQSVFCTLAVKLRGTGAIEAGTPEMELPGAYQEQGRFEPWLFRIAMNRLRDEMRRKGRQARSRVDLEHAERPGGRASGDRDSSVGEIETREQLRHMHAAIAQLPEADRLVIELRHLAELSFKQIAEVLGEPLGTVLARQHRALRKLREAMTPAENRRANAGGGETQRETETT